MPERALRADARGNQERLLAVAAEAFARDGTKTSLKAVAQAAGVGVGTLYRHFPTREALVEAVYANEVTTLCAAAAGLLTSLPPEVALRAWMEQFIDFLSAKHGMADMLRPVLLSAADRLHTRARLRAAIDILLRAGSARPGVDADDVLLGLGGIALIAGEKGQRDLASRLIALFLNGIELSRR